MRADGVEGKSARWLSRPDSVLRTSRRRPACRRPPAKARSRPPLAASTSAPSGHVTTTAAPSHLTVIQNDRPFLCYVSFLAHKSSLGEETANGGEDRLAFSHVRPGEWRNARQEERAHLTDCAQPLLLAKKTRIFTAESSVAGITVSVSILSPLTSHQNVVKLDWASDWAHARRTPGWTRGTSCGIVDREAERIEFVSASVDPRFASIDACSRC